VNVQKNVKKKSTSLQLAFNFSQTFSNKKYIFTSASLCSSLDPEPQVDPGFAGPSPLAGSGSPSDLFIRNNSIPFPSNFKPSQLKSAQ